MRQALALEQAGELEGSVKAYEDVLNDFPDSVEALAGLGRVHHRLRQYNEAVASFERALSLKPRDQEIRRHLARSYVQAGMPQKVFHLLSPNVVDEDQPWVHMLLATAYDAQDKVREAKQEFDRVLELDPRYPNAHFALGFIAWSTRDAEQAEREFRQEIALNPRHVPAPYYLTEVLEAQGKRDEAESLLRQLGREAPEAYLTHYGLGKLEDQRANPESAVKHFRRAIELQPDRPEAHYRLAMALQKLGRMAEAKQAFDRSRELQSHSGRPQAPHGMGRMRLRLPDLEQ